ncbi:MAG: hypothetical protein KA113_03270 [Syntrophaceae bacterium]|jgi:hypothetical protein|nr:hypothetical protein [Syntrophaceae bacterium]
MKKINLSLAAPVPPGGTDPVPAVAFAHLAAGFAAPASDDAVPVPYGFPAAAEEDLYMTGYLQRIFLRC